jgi:hypothetical protein
VKFQNEKKGGNKMSKVREIAERVYESARNELSGTKLDILESLLQNEAQHLEKVAESTTTRNIDNIATIFLPAIKKIVRDSVIEKIVGVQPVKEGMPTALVQYIDFVYSASYDEGSGDVKGQSIIDGPITTGYSRAGEGEVIKRGVDVVVRTKSAMVESRKLLSRWTLEAQESAQFVGMNIEKEITKAIASKILEEINYQIIEDLYKNASGGTATWEMPKDSDSPDVKDRKEKEIFYAIEDVAGQIFNKTGRYPTYMIVSPTIASILKRSGSYVALGKDNLKVARLFLQGYLEDIGMEVIVVRSLATNDILLGYKGDSEMEAGYFYCPQTPFKVSSTFFNVESWEFLKSVGTSYALAPVDFRLYGKVVVK